MKKRFRFKLIDHILAIILTGIFGYLWFGVDEWSIYMKLFATFGTYYIFLVSAHDDRKNLWNKTTK